MLKPIINKDVDPHSRLNKDVDPYSKFKGLNIFNMVSVLIDPRLV